MTTTKEITEYILALMTNASSLAEVKKWFKGEPPKKSYPSMTWGWVEWMGGPEDATTVATRAKITDRFYVVVVKKHPDQTTAESAAENFTDAIEALIKADLHLGNKVGGSVVVNREKEKSFQGDDSYIAIRVTVQTWRLG